MFRLLLALGGSLALLGINIGCQPKRNTAPASEISQRAGEETQNKIIVADYVVTMDENRRVLTPGAIAIEGDRIVKVGTESEAQSRLPGAPVHRFAKKVIIPGLVNAHTHISMSLLRGFSDDKDLVDWLNNYIFPAEKKNVTARFSAVGARLSCAEMLLGGTTMLADMYYFVDDISQEMDKCGIRAMIGTTFLDFPTPDNANWDAIVNNARTFVQKWKSHSRVSPALAPHAPYTVSREHLQQVAALAEELDTRILIHVAESPKEHSDIRAQTGKTPVHYLESIGFWSPRVTAAHMVQVAADEMAILAKHQVGVVHNPQSNMKLVSGIAPIRQFLTAGVRVGLGTDGAASNNDQDMFDEMRTANLLQKVATGDPKVLPAMQTLEIATLGGARSLHMEDRIGSLEEGKYADVVIVDMNKPHQIPVYNVVSQLVYATKSSDVTDVIVHGRFVVREKKPLFIDMESTAREVEELRQKIKNSL